MQQFPEKGGARARIASLQNFTHNAIFAYTSRFIEHYYIKIYRTYIKIRIKIKEYTSQNIEHTSQDFEYKSQDYLIKQRFKRHS